MYSVIFSLEKSFLISIIEFSYSCSCSSISALNTESNCLSTIDTDVSTVYADANGIPTLNTESNCLSTIDTNVSTVYTDVSTVYTDISVDHTIRSYSKVNTRI
jgi:hypothetical protein